MGYFNKNSLGEITSVTTNTMETLGNVATRVVMLTTQGLLNTAIILLMLLLFDYRIGLIGIIGTALFLLMNNRMQNAGKTLSRQKVESDTQVVSQTMEYLQGISEVKSYNMTGERTRKLNRIIEDNADINTKMEFTFIPYMTLQNSITTVSYTHLTAKSFYEGTTYRSDYMHITLTDEEEIPEVIGRLRSVYPNLMKVDYHNTRTQSTGIVDVVKMPEVHMPLNIFEEFYEKQNNAPLSQEQSGLLRKLIEEVWEEEK